MATLGQAAFAAKRGEEVLFATLKRRAQRNMAIVDSMPVEWRRLVHEYGLGKVGPLYYNGTPYFHAIQILNPINLDLDI